MTKEELENFEVILPSGKWLAEFDDIEDWCEETFGDDWNCWGRACYFRYEKDATLFKLKYV